MPSSFPFKSLALYRVKRTFTSQRSGDVFAAGSEVAYQDSNTNVYEGIEICRFIDRNSGKELLWHMDQIVVEGNWETYLESIPWPK